MLKRSFLNQDNLALILKYKVSKGYYPFGVFMLKNICSFLIVFVSIPSYRLYAAESEYSLKISPLQQTQIHLFWKYLGKLRNNLDAAIRNDKSTFYARDWLHDNGINYEGIERSPLVKSLNQTLEDIRDGKCPPEEVQGTPYEALAFIGMMQMAYINETIQLAHRSLSALMQRRAVTGILYLFNLNKILEIYSQENINAILQNQLKLKEYNEFKRLLDSYQEQYVASGAAKIDMRHELQEEEMEMLEKQEGVRLIYAYKLYPFPPMPEDVQKELLGEKVYNFLQTFKFKDVMQAFLFGFYKNPNEKVSADELIK